ncbi:MAG: hypothetical protein ACI4F9_05355 [Lachnospiraceae bacterium]
MRNQEYTDDITSYKQPSYQPYRNEEVGVFDWILTLIILSIPCLNFIMMFLWAFASGKASKRNFMRAKLIIMLVWILIFVILVLNFSGELSEILYEINQKLNEIMQQLPV